MRDMEEIGAVENAHTLLKEVYCNPDIPLAVRMRAAMAAIPYEMPRLAVTAQVSENDFAAILDRRLKHMEAIAANEPKMIEAAPVEVKSSTPSIGYRSLRRRI